MQQVPSTDATKPSLPAHGVVWRSVRPQRPIAKSLLPLPPSHLEPLMFTIFHVPKPPFPCLFLPCPLHPHLQPPHARVDP